MTLLSQRRGHRRILRPGQLVTMEYNDTRLNLIVDDKDVMTAIRCG
ncbi:I78 family peptidase inhibitor [Achromobacter xylosoxidans]|nr:I78 family peptidase inhibitor [Achromobacter xylosoxidans]MCZ8441877.1 I78 family peptidase inhibitor [Achromobacter xylosoxidans]MDC6160163.1 I78 family peptidase inhibitor [Achromobacter xylosoxidans]